MGKKVRTTTTAKTENVELVPQPHGGALLAGGKPGNKGGGRTPSEIRELMRKPLAKLLPIITEIAEAKDTQTVTCPKCGEKFEATSWVKASDKLKAVDLLARYGIGTSKEVEHKGMVLLMGRSLSD